MIGGEELVRELKQYQSICYYPSAGRDLSDIDYFASGCLPREERRAGTGMKTVAATDPLPDLYVHTDVNFYQEYAAGSEFPVSECGIHGSCEIVGFRELPAIASPNRICNNFPHSGRVFEYKLRVWNSARIVTLLYCLCENEAFVSHVCLAHGIRVSVLWSRDWFGGRTYGTWLANVLDRLHTRKVFADWLCIPGKRGEPSNRVVEETYPDLMTPSRVTLVKNEDRRWIDEGAHGWIEEYEVRTT